MDLTLAGLPYTLILTSVRDVKRRVPAEISVSLVTLKPMEERQLLGCLAGFGKMTSYYSNLHNSRGYRKACRETSIIHESNPFLSSPEQHPKTHPNSNQ